MNQNELLKDLYDADVNMCYKYDVLITFNFLHDFLEETRKVLI